MSSGEVLFILAFIVLPTAILVSSVWAVIFVRRRPDRVYRQTDIANETLIAETDVSQDQTAVLPTMPVHAEPQEDDLPVTEHDVIVITDEELPVAPVEEQVDETVVIDEDHEDETVARSEAGEVETPVLQSTEDLDDVVNTLREIDQVVIAEEPVEDPEEPPAAEFSEPEIDQTEEETFSETSELPVVEKSDKTSSPEPNAPAPQQEPAASEPVEQDNQSRWRRRKQSVKLRPGDPDAPRARGRNRDPQRQVPQIVRSSRRRDDASQPPPPEPDPDADSPSTPD